MFKLSVGNLEASGSGGVASDILARFLLVDATMTGKTTAEILDAAIDMQKVYLKGIGEIHGKTGYFRVTPGTEEENERFMKFIRAYFGK